jgi:hypothetical protein
MWSGTLQKPCFMMRVDCEKDINQYPKLVQDAGFKLD